MTALLTRALVAAAALALAAGVASAQLAVSSNDNKVALVNGAVKVVANPRPDTVTILDLARSPPKVFAELEVPGSVVSPPFSVAVTGREARARHLGDEGGPRGRHEAGPGRPALGHRPDDVVVDPSTATKPR